MQPAIARRLLDLNRLFYQTFAAEFSSTRGRLQPGVRRILVELQGDETILDLGCGNGELARQLARGGHRGAYTGLDFSPPLLASAGRQTAGSPARFLQADLSDPDWDRVIAGSQFDRVFAFAVLHHLPGADLRLHILKQVHLLLHPRGFFVHSVWQFLDSPRLRRRIQPWEAAGLSAGEVDPGDYLLDWRAGGHGLRYVHSFDEAELADLAAGSGFEVWETFRSDGEGGRLGLYQFWRPLASRR